MYFRMKFALFFHFFDDWYIIAAERQRGSTLFLTTPANMLATCATYFAPVPCPSYIKPTKISIFNLFGWMLVGLRNNTNVDCAYSNLQRPHQTTVTK